MVAAARNKPGRRHASTLLDRLLLWICGLALGLTIVYPSLRLVVGAVLDGDWSEIVTADGIRIIGNTFFICVLSVALAAILGVSLAFLVTRWRFPGRGPLAAMAYLPIALPPLVGTLSFYYLIGRDGFVPRIVQYVAGIEDFVIEGALGILIIHAYSFSVFFYAMTVAALERMDISQVEAARTLGASPWRAFRTVTIPMLMPALVGASLLTFMSSGASFSAPLFFGADFPVLSVKIYEEQTQFNEAGAMAYSLVLALLSLLGIVLFRSRYESGGTGVKGAPRELQSTSGKFLAGATAWICVGFLVLPHLNILWLSFVDHRGWYTEVVPTVFTLEHYATIFGDAAAFRPIQNSVWMSALAAFGCFAVGLPAAYLIGRKRRGGRWINALVMIPWALPGTVVAMNLIAAFNDPWLPLYNTVWLLPLAYFVRFIPLFSRMAAAAVEPFDVALIEAGRSLGGSPMFCFLRIVVPALAPALIAATALVFASALGEFVATILLYTPSNLPIAIQINMEWRGAGVGAAFAYSVLLMAMVTATFLVARRFASRVI